MLLNINVKMTVSYWRCLGVSVASCRFDVSGMKWKLILAEILQPTCRDDTLTVSLPSIDCAAAAGEASVEAGTGVELEGELT